MARQFTYIGTWGCDIQGGDKGKETSEGGIKTFLVNTADRLVMVANATPDVNAGIVVASRDGKFLYATDERKDLGGVHGNGGGVCAYKIDQETGTLEFLNEVSSAGAYPCNITTDASGRYVFVSNHGNHEDVVTRSVKTEQDTYKAVRTFDEGSIAMFPILEDGSLGECCDLHVHEGSSVVDWYQWTPHPHSIKIDPTSQFVLSGDKGSDRIYVYRIDYAHSRMIEVHVEHADPGCGPRHIAFHPTLPYMYINSELNSTVHSYHFDFETGKLTSIASEDTIPRPYTPPDPTDHFANNETADIRVHKSGKHLYVSNRGHNSIAVFDLDESGGITKSERVFTGGEIPRAIQIDLSGDVLYAVNQRTGNIVQFRLDGPGGIPAATGYEIQLSNPVCMEFVEL